MDKPLTLAEKIWLNHLVARSDQDGDLLYVDRHFLDETCFFCFDDLLRSGRSIRRPDLTFAVADHTVPTRDRAQGVTDPEIAHAVTMLDRYAAQLGFTGIGMHDPRQGIIHVIAPELGITLPGALIACGDSHTATHGALGALGLGIGLSESTHILATQTLWQRRYAMMRIRIDGALPPGVTAKDVILAIIRTIGAGGAGGHIVEYAGSAIEAMSIEQRMTVCNMSVEAGARAGLIAPYEAVFTYLRDRAYAPQCDAWEQAVEQWSRLRSDPDAAFDREVAFDAREILPMVTWGTSPEDAVPVTGRVPDPAGEPHPERRQRAEAALRYMDLTPGTPLEGLRIDRAFIGSCTNGRIGDLRAAAAIARGRRAVVPAVVVPGSRAVRRAAEAEGLDRVFMSAGFEWRDAGCSMCVGMNGDLVPPGERCASTSNRNFVGRQGPGSRTHLMSPAMAAAAAVTGRITDVRKLA